MDLLTLIDEKKYVVLDGAIGTELDRRGAAAGALANLGHPGHVLEVQGDYVSAGSDALITNTFCMNRIFIETHGSKADVAEVNRRGVEIAREAAAGRACILGEIGLAGQMLEPLGYYKETQFYEAFLQQAQAVEATGVNAFIIETATDIREALVALRVCVENFDIPTIVSLAFSTVRGGGRTMMGDRAAQCAENLEKAGAAVVGMNCGDFDPRSSHEIVKSLREGCSLPVMAEPNGGRPRLEKGRTVYDMTATEFANEVIQPCIEAGATIVGGCCGTTPDHIRAVRELVDSLRTGS